VFFDWLWEQDAEFRLTRIDGRGAPAEHRDRAGCLGKLPWEAGLEVHDPGGWPALRALLEAGRPFRDVVIHHSAADGTRRYLSVSGEPAFDEAGRPAGYRGIANDITERRHREDELARFRAAMDASPDMIYLTDRETMRFVYVNDTACQLVGFSREEFLKMGPADVLRVDRRELERMFDEVIAAGAAGTVQELKSITKGGLRTMVDVRRRAVRLDDRWLIVTTCQDISLRKRAEQAMTRSRRMYAALSATNEAIIRAASPEELYRQVCAAAVEGGEFLTTAVIERRPGSGPGGVLAVNGTASDWLREAWQGEAALEGEGLVETALRTGAPCVSHDFLKDERTRPWHQGAARAGIASAAAVPLVRSGEAVGVLLFYAGEKRAFDGEIVALLERMAENVVFALDNLAHEGQRRRAEERIQYLASHDALTRLPNRVMFSQMLNSAIATAKRYGRCFAVMFIDLDRFKVVNDLLGHEAGDLLLQEVAGRLRQALRASDVVARLGGDEFVVLLHEVTTTGQVATVARKILSAVLKPVRILGQECRVTASIGISLYPIDAQDEPSLMKNADMAMYLAKADGKNTFQVYSEEIKAQSLERMALETNLREALGRDELSLHYQAKLDLATGTIKGVEALLRWQSPVLGAVPPAQLIPVAEETGLIVPIGRWVLRTACAQNMAWQRAGLPPVCMAVNLSPRQFVHEELPRDIAAALEESGMPGGLLELEVTESMVMHNIDRAVKVLTAIKELGVRLAIDDFGTGYSSLAQLKRFPIDTLKVDRSFIREIPGNAEDKAITKAIIAMGKSLSLTIVAEGVETEAQEAFLQEHACDEMQGYYFSKPVAAHEFAELLRGHVPTPKV
jgi:diguanylate cyclase (GGDEF)-like protein/PAS domain S-box-containing protein